MKSSRLNPHRTPPRVAPHRPDRTSQWAWHLRTLIALRDHLTGTSGDREREPGEPLAHPTLHVEDQANDIYDRELARALTGDRTIALREIVAAIRRIQRGTYGRCERSGRWIPKEELRAIPWRRTAASSSVGGSTGAGRR